jgi:hypothetical protein
MSNRNQKIQSSVKHKKLQTEETIVENLTVNNAETVQAEETIAENLTVNNAETVQAEETHELQTKMTTSVH